MTLMQTQWLVSCVLNVMYQHKLSFEDLHSRLY